MTYPCTRWWRVWALQWPCRLVLQSDPTLLCSLQEFHQSQGDLGGLIMKNQVRCKIKIKGDKCVTLTPCRHAVSLLQFSEVSQPRVFDNNCPSLQSVLPHRVLAFMPDLERSVVTLHNLIYVNVVQLWQDGVQNAQVRKKKWWRKEKV